ncbi:FkbM family methyltransferase [Rhodocytophaga aerolata]|uniref:FkbM family methyltransferase n=1 Tax=Rhodocytophaga aerolata TaxID=455078 RepID=A0ABT8R0P6_9BACT|nr:FkbM family methyltransferase [Rhodocytophaga aerolata]MDO1444893.1 FkbM family methyltransferase [Rhodocytophaga aerolata]
MKKVKKIVWNSLNAIGMGGAVQLILESALLENGWFRSYHTKQSVDRDGQPIPWCTYPYIHFVEPRLQEHMEVFEFGCGNSTLWYSSRVKSIKAVEHDKNWVKLMESKLPANAQVVFQALQEDDNYVREVGKSGKKYHIIIIDGRKRSKSAREAVQHLTEDGVIVWDNTDLPQYQEGVKHLLNVGFKRLDFWGLSPITAHLNCTTVFYKSTNCLHI